MESEEKSCPVCKSEPFLTPSMILMVSPCYHLLCNSCVDRLYMQGQAPCPQCGTILRRSSFHVPKFSDLRVEKECHIRKHVLRCLNKRPEDFNDLRAYNDYLEQVEVTVFQLFNDIDVEAIMSQLDTFRRENAGIIERNVLLEKKEEQSAKEEHERLQEARLQREHEILAELENEEKARLRQEAHMIDALSIEGSTLRPNPSLDTKSHAGSRMASGVSKRPADADKDPVAAKVSKVDLDYLWDVQLDRSKSAEGCHVLRRLFKESVLKQIESFDDFNHWATQALRKLKFNK